MNESLLTGTPKSQEESSRESAEFFKRLKNVKAFCIDVDDTLVRFKAGLNPKDYRGTASLLHVLRAASQELTTLSESQIEERIQEIEKTHVWWHWSDFIVSLGLDPQKFWEFAYQYESKYLEPTEPGLEETFKAFQEAGFKIYMTSNNPSSGILHKMQIAGIPAKYGCRFVDQLLGATELQAMKSSPLYWKKVAAHTGYLPEELAVIGDNNRDDLEVPLSEGYGVTFLVGGSKWEGKRENVMQVETLRSIRSFLQK